MFNKIKLEQTFKNAIKGKHMYIGVRVKIQGFPESEMIINSSENFESKLEYYKKAYDENLVLKTYSGIQIVACESGSLANVTRKLEENRWRD